MKMASNTPTKSSNGEPVRKGCELDSRIVAVIQEEYSDFAKYLPNKQDQAMYQRKVKEYWDKINARLREMEI